MNKLNVVQHGAVKLPPGFRFQPTDEEIVFQYLLRKISSQPLPASVVPEIISICKYDPWDLPGDAAEEDRYFFAKKEAKYQTGSRSNRTTSSGYWKATGSDKRITSPRITDKMGMRKTLVFHRGKPPNGSRTDWIMHEYRLVNPATQTTMVQIGSWVLCHMFLRKRSVENDGETIQGCKDDRRVRNLGVAQLMRGLNDLGPSTSSTSSCGSSITSHEVNSSGIDHEETSGSPWP